jgi:signal transduction histidine kinase
MKAGSLWGETVGALLAPRRLVPVVLMAVPLLVAQVAFSPEPLAGPIGLLLVLVFWLAAPWGWRVLFPLEESSIDGTVPAATRALRAAAYAAASAAVVFLTGGLVPHLLGMRLTFLTDPWSLMVASALFVVGGWGLGRDIELERGWARERRRAVALARDAERAQLLALRSHLDPHFLFNTLNAIAEWCREDGEVAERAILELSSMLRTVLEGVKAPAWSLGRELDLAETLLTLHAFRDPELFTFVKRWPEPLPAIELPPMLLLPLVENAIKHGPGAGARGEIIISVERVERDETGAVLRIVVDNPGHYRGRRIGGEGVSMVERRIEHAYGGRGRCTIGPAPDDDARTRVMVELPFERPEASA